MKVFQFLKNVWLKFAEFTELIGSTILLGLIFFVFIGLYNLGYRFFHLFSKKPVQTRWEVFNNNQETLEEVSLEF